MASSAPDHLRTPGLISNRPCYEGIKILCHNIVVLIQSMFELGVMPTLAGIQDQRLFVQDGQLHKMSA